MKTSKRTLLVLVFGIFGVVLTGSFWFSTPKVTEAACGASTTSCKTCHEIKGEDPVSQKGDWHTQHAFGDFCQACHLGSATENDREKAHLGMAANPLTQADQSCASCHPDDTAARAAKYGGTVTGSPGSSGSSGANSTAGKTNDSETPGGEGVTVSAAATQIPAGGNPNYDVIDFNVNKSLPWLAWTIGIINVLMLLGLAVLIWRWKKGLWPWVLILGRSKKVPFRTLPPEVQEVFGQLLAGNMETVLALKKILSREDGRTVLQRVGNLPDHVWKEVCELNDNQLESWSPVKDLSGKEGSEKSRGL